MSTPPFITSSRLQSRNIAHGFFGRRGGVSTGLYDSLNVGEGSNDDIDAIARNREIVANALGAKRLQSVYQIHSPDVLHLTEHLATRPEADAMVTTTPGLALCILTADCVPVLFADAKAGVIGAAHAGWKGALGGVLEATVSAMQKLGANPANMSCAIGPAIQKASYEVGPEFRDTFIAKAPWSANLFSQGEGDRWRFDLPRFVKNRLTRLKLGWIDLLPHDTCALEDEFFSNRRRNHRGEADYGRNASVILLKS